MNKILLLTLSISSVLFALDIPTQKTTIHTFKEAIALNSKVIQRSNEKESIVSLVSGTIKKYYVTTGQDIQAGDKVVLIESMTVAKMTAEYIAQKRQFDALKKNYKATKELYQKGMSSLQEFNAQSIQMNAMLASLTALQSQLMTLNIDPAKLTSATPNYILYAHSNGKISQLFRPLHAAVDIKTPLVNVIKDQAFYLQSYLPLHYAGFVKKGQKLVVKNNNVKIIADITQILPEMDEATQRVILLSRVNGKIDNLFINAYLPSTLYLQNQKQYTAVKKSALSFFNNEWVVFVPSEEKDAEIPYEAHVVKVITQDEEYVAIEGLALNAVYVSDKSYYVKSMLLKSALGDGD